MPGKPRTLSYVVISLVLAHGTTIHAAGWDCRPNPAETGWLCTETGVSAPSADKAAKPQTPAPPDSETDITGDAVPPRPLAPSASSNATPGAASPADRPPTAAEQGPSEGAPPAAGSGLGAPSETPSSRPSMQPAAKASPIPPKPSQPETRTAVPGAQPTADATPATPEPSAPETRTMPAGPQATAEGTLTAAEPTEPEAEMGEHSASPEVQITTTDAPLEPALPPSERAKARIDDGLAWSYCGPRSKNDFAIRGPKDPSEEGQLVHISADAVELWRKQNLAVLEGRVEVDRGAEHVEADWAQYDRGNNLLDARGNIFFEQPGLRIAGAAAHFDLDQREGELQQAEYRLTNANARGSAESAFVEGRDHSRFRNISYTTCRPGDDAWVIDAEELTIDQQAGTGTARHAKLRLKGVPVAYLPYASFPIDGRRKSGFLVPSVGTSDTTGVDVSIPYYFNIAPNLDAILEPRYMSDRGLMLGGELRYLTRRHSGELRAEILPNDQKAGAGDPKTRGAFSFRNQGVLAPRLSSDILFNYVSDDVYLEDFGNSLNVTSRRQLERHGDLRYSWGDWNFLGRLQYFQTVDPNLARVDYPYSRMPQLVATWQKPNQRWGLSYLLDSEYVYFNHPDKDKVRGQRLALRPAVSLPLRRSYGYVTPKASVLLRNYDLVDPAPDQTSNRSLAIPTFSLDGGLTFERRIDWFGRASRQTLEPRLFYLYTPYKNQDDLPVFDTTDIDFSFASLFRENRFTGRDRAGDANQITLALTSRTLDNAQGEELLRASIGEIFYFRDRRVQLPDQPEATNSRSTIAAETVARLSRNWSTAFSLFWNPTGDGQVEVGSASVNYRTPDQKIFNLGYRFNRGVVAADTNTRVEDTDVSVRWPFANGIHLIGRWKYSLFYDRTMDSFLGIEYERCCWAVRALARHFITDISSGSNTTFMMQLELKGLGDIGSGIEDFLERGIRGYRID